jgi:hypothetical protein
VPIRVETRRTTILRKLRMTRVVVNKSTNSMQRRTTWAATEGRRYRLPLYAVTTGTKPSPGT